MLWNVGQTTYKGEVGSNACDLKAYYVIVWHISGPLSLTNIYITFATSHLCTCKIINWHAKGCRRILKFKNITWKSHNLSHRPDTEEEREERNLALAS